MINCGSWTVSVTVMRFCEVIGGVTTFTGSTLGPGGIGPKYFVSNVLELLRIEVAGNGDGRIVGRVELLVEVANVRDPRGLDVGMAADHDPVVRMSLGKKLVVRLLRRRRRKDGLHPGGARCARRRAGWRVSSRSRPSIRKPMRSLSSHRASSSWLLGMVSK